MRRLLFGLACLATFGAAYYFRCRHVNAKRYILGAFRCPDCTDVFAELPTLEGDGHVPAMRRMFSRKGMTVTRSGWVN